MWGEGNLSFLKPKVPAGIRCVNLRITEAIRAKEESFDSSGSPTEQVGLGPIAVQFLTLTAFKG